ncbi:MAG: hypothetical protein K9N55_01505 [Phycisphaerae bacterium]|nr:hypothetical protein [Phycisphaerae bacterium]
MKIVSMIKTGVILVVLGAVGTGGVVAWQHLFTNKTIEALLTENTHLKQALTHLSEETQIGYAKVVSQDVRDGRLFTRLMFVETRPNEPLKPVLKKEYEVQGDIVHFDALIVKFGQERVMDGREKALYLWRRIYGENQSPDEGLAINHEGQEPARYSDLCEKLSLKDRNLFWTHIWTLSNDPDHLSELGVQAIYGNVVYHKLEPGLIYVFKIDNTGSLYPEVVPDL